MGFMGGDKDSGASTPMFNPAGYSNPFGAYKYDQGTNDFVSYLSPEESQGYLTNQSKLQGAREAIPSDGNAWNTYTDQWVNTYLNKLTDQSVPQYNAQMYAKGVTPDSTGYSRGLAGLSSNNAQTATLGGYDLATNQLNNMINSGNFFSNDLQKIYERIMNTAKMGYAGGVQQQNWQDQQYANQMAQQQSQNGSFGDLSGILGNMLGGGNGSTDWMQKIGGLFNQNNGNSGINLQDAQFMNSVYGNSNLLSNNKSDPYSSTGQYNVYDDIFNTDNSDYLNYGGYSQLY